MGGKSYNKFREKISSTVNPNFSHPFRFIKLKVRFNLSFNCIELAAQNELKIGKITYEFWTYFSENQCINFKVLQWLMGSDMRLGNKDLKWVGFCYFE